MIHFDFSRLVSESGLRRKANALLGQRNLPEITDSKSLEVFLREARLHPDLVLQLAQVLYPTRRWAIFESRQLQFWIVAEEGQKRIFDVICWRTLSAENSLRLAKFGDLIPTSLVATLQAQQSAIASSAA